PHDPPRRAPRERAPSSISIAPRFPNTCSKQSCSATSAALSPTPRRSKPGLLQLAHRGTLFLDEIDLLPAPLQPKLLKFLDDGAVRRLGGTSRWRMFGLSALPTPISRPP